MASLLSPWPGLPPRAAWWPLFPLASRGPSLEGPLGSLRWRAHREAGTWRLDAGPWPSCEAEGWCWLWAGGAPSEGPPGPPPAWPRRPRWWGLQLHRSAELAAPWTAALENSFDYVHGRTVHPWTQPAWYLAKWPWRPRLEQRYRAFEGGVELEGWAGGRRLSYRHRFVPPATLHLRVGRGALGLDVVAVHVPAGPQRTRLAIRVALPGWGQGVGLGLNALLAQDAAIVEAQAQAQAWDEALGWPLTEAHAPTDAPALLMRAQLRAIARGEAPGGSGPWRSLWLHT